MNVRSATRSDRPRWSPDHLDLDAAAIAETKKQIGGLVTEIADLAKTCEHPSQFYPAMLSRLVSAMAGTGAGVWQCDGDTDWQLLHAHLVPDALIDDDDLSIQRRPSLEHRALLDCVARERQPILVPPGDIAANTDRPTNPIQQCLIYSPIPIEMGNIRLWLQVIQPPSGGVATQRGYLRFAAQIADLTADFLKTYRLRQFENQQQLFALSQQILSDAATTTEDARSKLTKLTQQLREMIGADQVFLLQRKSLYHPWQLEIASELSNLDPRSEGSTCSANFCKAMVEHSNSQGPTTVHAIDRRSADRGIEPEIPSSELSSDRFMTLFAAATVSWIPLVGGTADQPLGVGCLAYWTWPTAQRDRTSLGLLLQRAQTLGRLGLQAIRPPLLHHATMIARLRPTMFRGLVLRLASSRGLKFAVGSLVLLAVACIPVPSRIVAPGTLQPQMQFRHFAPLDARVVTVHVDYGQKVTAGEPLLQLEDRQLSRLVDEAVSQQLKSKERRREIESRLLRGDRLPSDLRYELEGELETLRAMALSEQQRVDGLQQQMERLTIRAAESGVVATWNARQLLQDRPVRVGQMLLLVQQPDGPWKIDARIPQKEVGRLLQAASLGVPVAQCTLKSHPDRMIPAVYLPGNAPAVLSESLDASEEPALHVTFAVPREELPQQNAGSSAQIAIELGRTRLGWSILGDAITSLWAKVRLWI